MSEGFLYIPEQLEEYKEGILQSVKPTIKVKAEKGSTKLWESKIGGNPYLPIGADAPKSAKGVPLKLLAQINFEDVPPMENMPKTGILQFYTDVTHYLIGMSLDNRTEQKDFRVIYHPEVIKDRNKLIVGFEEIQGETVIDIPEAKLEFAKGVQPVTSGDYRFNSEYLKGFDEDKEVKDGDNLVELGEFYYTNMSESGHRMGGYPFFTQFDPRDEGSEYDTLLLQIDSDESIGLMWGDVGVANFFINKDKLAKLDFSDVLYNWDCC
ncbi:YwqG family protein [Bacillus cereus]|uniref:YwqG family protein n=1 Tax=Bacillus cereus TaxID=1396 RepID=UPI001C8C4F4C|nr:YwqG family protein [Bacillus cereus]MBX9158535.1 DUF1963 domain-containing protein [Bacillus cereus]